MNIDTNSVSIEDIDSVNQHYSAIIADLLNRVLPAGSLVRSENGLKNTELPLTHYTEVKGVPCSMSVVVVFKKRPNGFKFVFEMISRWLVPGKRLNVPVMFTADFRLPNHGNETYGICEMVIHLSDQVELDEVNRNLPIIDTEIRLGINSHYYARRIMEVKGLSSDEKTAQIQEYIAYLIERLPRNLDNDVFSEMQHLLVMCRDEFKAVRDVKHLSRIITVQYLFRKELKKVLKNEPNKRHLFVKLFLPKLQLHEGEKTVLSFVIGMNFLRDKELLEEKHVLRAVRQHVPSARGVEHSFFANRHGSERICTLYIEVEKENGAQFCSDEIRALRAKLPGELEDRIEQLMHPVFNPRNEEEIMRNILSLSSQIRYLRDIPQVFITFDEQTELHVYFTVILVRVLKPGSLSIQDLFCGKETALEYIHDRCKRVGSLRRKYPKEATVFRVRLCKDVFLRRDNSIDLYKARQTVVNELSQIVGEVRDYNGGMLSKQSELLSAVRDRLSGTMKYNDLLLENFFYSLMPVVMRTVLEPEILKTVFVMLLELIEERITTGKKQRFRIKQDEQLVYAMIPLENRSSEERLQKEVEKLNLSPTSLATSRVKAYDTSYLGYIFRSDERDLRELFIEAIKRAQTPQKPEFSQAQTYTAYKEY